MTSSSPSSVRRKSGPARSCNCGDVVGCRPCRKREQQRRYSHGLEKLPPLPSWGGRRVLESRLSLPTDPVTLAYIAGLFDGEGSLPRNSAGNHVVQIGMTDEPVIRWLASFGGSLKIDPAKRGSDGHARRVLYRWRLLAQVEVAQFLTAILPYLRVKRERAQECLLALERMA